MTPSELNARGAADFGEGKRDEALYAGIERANEAYRWGWNKARIDADMARLNACDPISAPLPPPPNATVPVLPEPRQGAPKATEPATGRGTAEPQLDLFG